MAEKLCLQWNDFQDNVKNAFGHLRDSTDFVDVTLACEDDRQIEAHKVILAASSPFFQRILKRNKHSHPLIYMKGIKSNDMIAIVDFLYFGEANVYQENLDSFLAIAEELQLKGLEGSKDQEGADEEEQLKIMEKNRTNHVVSRTPQSENETMDCSIKTRNNTLALLKTSVLSADLKELDESVKAMMETSEKIIQEGNQQRHAKVCKVCGKEGQATDIKRHIEASHLEGVSVPCNPCDKILRTREALRKHKKSDH